MTLLRRLLGLDDAPPPPPDRETGVTSEAERHYEDAAREAGAAMADAEAAVRKARRHWERQSAITDALLQSRRDWVER